MSNSQKQGAFIISLDLELYWGVRDKRSIEQYRENLDGVHNAVEQILALFTRYGIHATWATLGFLYFENKQELDQHLPEILPEYDNEALSPYRYMHQAGDIDNQYHFAPDLIQKIKETEGQEIGTHSFSHFYCLEKGQGAEAFKADIQAAIEVAEARKTEIRSMVFPRNQWNLVYLPILDELGIKCFRGTEKGWLYKALDQQNESQLRRALRLLDAYVNLSGHHTFALQECMHQKPYNVPASRFLRPYSQKLASLDGLRLRRIKKAMSHAAETDRMFHLWWHPHNFGAKTNENLCFLEKLLSHFDTLRKQHHFQSLSMGEIST